MTDISNKYSKSHFMRCIAGLELEGLTRIAPRLSPFVVISNENTEQSLKSPFANIHNFNERVFKRRIIPQFVPNSWRLGF